MLNILDWRIDCIYLSPEFVKDYICNLSTISGFWGIMLFLPIYYWLTRRAEKKFKKLYPDEKILYVVTTGIWSTALLTYFPGALFGSEILPFFILKNIPASTGLTSHNLWLYVLKSLFLAWFYCFHFSLTYIFSDKRIFSYLSLYIKSAKYYLKNYILYNDIESVEFSYFYFAYQALFIKLKYKRDEYRLCCLVHLKEAKELILHYMNSRENAKAVQKCLDADR